MKKLYFFVFFSICSTFAFSQSVDEQVLRKNSPTQQNDIEGFKMYPNPVSNGSLFITTFHNNRKNIQVYDVLGKLIIFKTLESNKNHLNVSKLNSGIYILKVTEHNKTATRKLVIK